MGRRMMGLPGLWLVRGAASGRAQTAALLQAVRFFQEMTMVFVLTQGGPVNATMVLSLYTYKIAFEDWDFGLASTVGTFWLFALLVFAMLYVRFALRRVVQ